MRTAVQRSTTLVLIAAVVTMSACHRRGSWNLARLHSQLRATLVLDRSVGRPGDAIGATYTITNNGPKVVEACFGTSVHIAVRDTASISDMDHPTCAPPRTRLATGESESTRFVLSLPQLDAGTARVSGSVEVLDPTRCQAIGCRGVHLAVEAGDIFTVED